jgi:hypothetical protein
MRQLTHSVFARPCLWLFMTASLAACDSQSGPAAMDAGMMARPDAARGGADGAMSLTDAASETADAALDAATDSRVEPVADAGMSEGPDAAFDGSLVDAEIEPAACADTCARVAECLIEVCEGYGPNARRQLESRCEDRCTPTIARALAPLSCNEMAQTLGEQFPQVAADCGASEPSDGVHALYIGHSFGRAFAERMPVWTQNAGVVGHTQDVVFRGGSNGAPQALWDNQGARAEIQGILDGGDVDVLIMICCSASFLMNGSDPAIRLWMDYALERNPNTRFALALPWPDFPADYASAVDYAALWLGGQAIWHVLIDQLREAYPGVDISCIPHGRAALELRTLFEAGNLPDVDAMTSGNGDAIFRDRKGHADDILLDLGSLVWVGALYEVDLTGYPLVVDYETDLIDIAEMIIAEDDHIR